MIELSSDKMRIFRPLGSKRRSRANETLLWNAIFLTAASNIGSFSFDFRDGFILVIGEPLFIAERAFVQKVQHIVDTVLADAILIIIIRFLVDVIVYSVFE